MGKRLRRRDSEIKGKDGEGSLSGRKKAVYGKKILCGVNRGESHTQLRRGKRRAYHRRRVGGNSGKQTRHVWEKTKVE